MRGNGPFLSEQFVTELHSVSKLVLAGLRVTGSGFLSWKNPRDSYGRDVLILTPASRRFITRAPEPRFTPLT